MGGRHSSLSPSSAKRWLNCPGSIALIAKCPAEKPNIYAAEGTVAHGLAEELVTGKATLEELEKRVGDEVEEDGFDIEITEEMIEGITLYRDTIAEDVQKLKAQGRAAKIIGKAEQRVGFKGEERVRGTSDFILYQKGNTLFVYDFKFGNGVVEAEENEQMCIYAVAAMDSEAGWAFDRVEVIIVQPRIPGGDEPDRWSAPIQWFKDFRDTVMKGAKKTDDPMAKIVGGDWCDSSFCPARGSCNGLQLAVQEQVKADFSVLPSDSAPMPDTQFIDINKIEGILRWEKVVDSWFKAVRERTKEILETGGKVPGMKLVQGRSNRTWSNEKAAINKYGEDIYAKPKLKSPAQLEKTLDKAGKKELAESGLVVKPEGQKTVAFETDKREALPSSATEDFQPLNVEQPISDDPLALNGGGGKKEYVDPLGLTAPKKEEISSDPLDQLMGTSKNRGPVWPG